MTPTDLIGIVHWIYSYGRSKERGLDWMGSLLMIPYTTPLKHQTKEEISLPAVKHLTKQEKIRQAIMELMNQEPTGSQKKIH